LFGQTRVSVLYHAVQARTYLVGDRFHGRLTLLIVFNGTQAALNFDKHQGNIFWESASDMAKQMLPVDKMTRASHGEI
jgi:hypothetical protein